MLLDGRFGAILATARLDACKVVVGPTVGLVPDAYIRRTRDVLGDIYVTRGDEFLDTLAEGHSGYHFFKSAWKIVLRSRRKIVAQRNGPAHAA